MKLKTATLIALIAVLINCLTNVASTIIFLAGCDFELGMSYYTSTITGLLVNIGLIIFFGVLYSKQK